MERRGDAPPDDVPLVLAREGQHGPVIHAANRTARGMGIGPGARIVDMRAVCAELQVEYADPGGDRAALDRLAIWARRWCPWTVRDGEDGLILDTTGSDHLMGGEAGMLRDMEEKLSLLGLSSHLAVAPTWGAAWALARFGPVRSICATGEVERKLANLPVDGLRLEPETLLLLRRLGLKTIGALMKVPRLSLARRFVRTALEANPLMRLDQALGKLAEPVASVEIKPHPRVESRLAEPILDPAPHVPELCEALCTTLGARGEVCRRLYLNVYHTDGEVSRLEVATSVSTRDPAHLASLFRDRIERINPGFGFDLITLEAGGVEREQTVQKRLDGEADEDVQINRLVDRLTAKFGARAVTRTVLCESHVPERAERQAPALAEPETAALPVAKERPIRLLDRPEEVKVLYEVPEGPPAQFVWRRQTHRVVRYAGPERIAPEWWKDRPGTRLRDYFKIEDQNGRRIWLYREGVHGDGRGGEPHWFVHGFFA
ncbi:DNA polymerase Y family protein [Roseovarius sp. SCSIO 43702]|uniref:Y-family DNA polymerase n=1 Tax=Roseovarius sp. SCSIO 43702 TaxID=2823043 RepID=UPI001C73A928|nr:DNA polymerase Y family protein [Roseovarius sp. SCSIO 43702]QYX58657.1 DNA polymerase Y family protein [Roseovarius sp. SCSIO 43702]